MILEDIKDTNTNINDLVNLNSIFISIEVVNETI